MANSTPIALASSSADRKSLLLGIAWPLIAISTVFVAMRFYCRIRLLRKVWWDDYMILVSLACGIATTVIWTIYANNGGCRHSDSLTLPQLIKVARLNWILQPFAIVSLVTGKLSVACLILRLQSPTKWRTYLLFVLSAIAVVIGTIVIILVFAQCTPVSLLWDPQSAPNGHCWNPNVVTSFAQAVGGYLGFLDIVFATLPVQLIWNLKLNRKKKIATGIYLSTGWLAFVFDVIKTVELRADSVREDRTWDTVWFFNWNAFEISTVIIAACIPTLIPLFDIMTGRRSRSHFDKKSNYPINNSFHLRSLRRSDKHMKRDGPGTGFQTLMSDDNPKETRNEVTEDDNKGEIRTREWSAVEA